MSADKYPSIFSLQMETIVYLMWNLAPIYEPKVLLFFMRFAVLIVIIISAGVCKKMMGIENFVIAAL